MYASKCTTWSLRRGLDYAYIIISVHSLYYFIVINISILCRFQVKVDPQGKAGELDHIMHILS